MAGSQKIKSKPDTPRKSARNAHKGTIVTAEPIAQNPPWAPCLGMAREERAHTLTHSFTGTHTHTLSHTFTLTGTLTLTHTHTHTHAVTHSYTHTHALKMHSHTCMHPQIHSHLHIQTHTHTPHQKGSQRDPEPEPACQLWHYGSQPEAEEDPLHPEHTGPPRAPHPEHCASAPTWSRRGCAKARPWMALAGLQALSCPCQAGSCPCLTLLSGSTSRQPSGVWPSLSLLAATSHSALGGCQL